MINVSIIIPYFQRDPGILRRALESIYAQELPQKVAVLILIVDDQSPAPPEPEIHGLTNAAVSIKIVKRANGGPAKARNTGLNALQDPDFVAFLDSDDTWSPGHLATGLAALAEGAEFYFANNWYEHDKTWFEGLGCLQIFLAATAPDAIGIYRMSASEMMPFMLQECVAHTSTVIFDHHHHPALRFDEDLDIAGEDYMFWLSLTQESRHVAFSPLPMASRGRGIDLYRAALRWNNPDCVRRLLCTLLFYKKVSQRYGDTHALRQQIERKKTRLRRGIAYLLMRNSLAHPRTNSWVLGQLLKKDSRFWIDLPQNAVTVLYGRLSGNLDFPVG